MLRFENIEYLWLLLLIPVLLAVWLFMQVWRRKMLRRFGDIALLRVLMPEYSFARSVVKFVLLLLAITLVVIMLARPQLGGGVSVEKKKAVEVVIALDISNSMLAKDVAPSRLKKSKLIVESLTENFDGDKIGLVVFAGDAYVQLPMTQDYVSAKMLLQTIDPSLIASQGTDIGEAIALATNCFTKDSDTGKAIVVITDGEDHEGEAEDMARKAEKEGIHILLMGIGSPQGTPIQMGEQGEYLKDREGKVVMSALNETMCRNIAEAGHGTYIHVDNSSVAEKQLSSELEKIQTGMVDKKVYSNYTEIFQIFGVIAIILLIVEAVMSERKTKFRIKKIWERRK